MVTSRRPRRAATQWQQLVAQQQASGLSAPAFCKREDLSYASFIQWRRRLGQSELTISSGTTEETRFIELTAPCGSSEVPERWLIELDLGGGVQLRIAQPR